MKHNISIRAKIFAALVGVVSLIGLGYETTININQLRGVGIQGAVGNGTTDDSAAFVSACNNQKEIWLSSGYTYFFGTSVTLPCNIKFVSGSQFSIGTGVTVTFTGQVIAPKIQIFTYQGTGQVLLPATNKNVYAEWFGAHADWNGSTGTDNTAAMNDALQAVHGGGHLQLLPGTYMVSGTVDNRKSSTGIIGASQGYYTYGTPSNIISTSSTADIIDCNPGATSSQVIFWNQFKNFALYRSVVPSATSTATGLSLNFCGGNITDHVISNDSIRAFYVHGNYAYGIGGLINSEGQWGEAGVTETTGNLYCIYVDSADGNPENSSRYRHDSCGQSGVSATTYGAYVYGTDVNDIMFDGLETAALNYGVYINRVSGSTTGIYSSDIHFVSSILDGCVTSCIYVNNIGPGGTPSVNFDEGWISSYNTTGNLIDVENSTGVNFQNILLNDSNTGNNNGIYVNNSHQIRIANSFFQGFPNSAPTQNAIFVNASDKVVVIGNTLQMGYNTGGAVIQLNGSTGVTVASNVLDAGAGGNMVWLVGSSHNSISSNPITGAFATGILLDANSGSNSIVGVNAIFSSGAFTAVTNNGTGNAITN